MIILKKLKWDKCFSYGEGNHLELGDTGLTQIVGVNGVGKSSIPIIIEEVLYNKNSKGVKKPDIPNRGLDGTYNIELTLSVDNEEYTIRSARNKTLRVELFKGEENISSHTSTGTLKQIEKILGLDFKTFSQLVYQNPNSSLQFLTSTDTARKKFLVELLGLDRYLQFFDKFKELHREQQSILEKRYTQLETYTKWMEENTSIDFTPKKDIQLPEINSSLNTLVQKLQHDIQNIASINKARQNNINYKRQLASIRVEPVVGVVTSYDSHLSKLSEVKTLLSAEKNTLKKVNELGNRCHTCNQEIPSEFKDSIVAKASRSIEELTQEATALVEEIKGIKEVNAKIESAQKIANEFESIYRSIDQDLPDTLLSNKELTEQLVLLQATIKEQSEQLKKAKTSQAEVDRYNARLLVIAEQAEKTNRVIAEIEAELPEIKTLVANLELLKKALSTNGLLAYKIESLVFELEDLVNEYLVELSDGRFTLGFSVQNDKLNVDLTDNGMPIEIVALSSGELARVTTATLLAIRKLMNSISKSKINVLFLDEVIAVLDSAGRDTLVSILQQETTLDTFVVSHEWQHPLLNKLHIIQEEGVSRIEHGR